MTVLCSSATGKDRVTVKVSSQAAVIARAEGIPSVSKFITCSGPALNAYKNKITTASKIEVCVVDVPKLSSWYHEVVDGQNLRDRLAVSCSGLSRGSFGSAMADSWQEMSSEDTNSHSQPALTE